MIENNVFDSITIICFWASGLPEEEYIHPKINVIRLRTRYSGKAVSPFRKAPAFWKELISVLKKVRPVVINVHQVKILPIIPLLSLYGIKPEYVYDAHELETETFALKNTKLKSVYKIFERLLIKRFSLVIVVSKSIEEWYKMNYGINNVVTVRNCPEYAPYLDSDKLRSKLKIGKDTMIFLYQGGLSKGRGIEILLETFSKNILTKKCIVFMGNGLLENKVKDLADTSDQIFYHPAVPRNDLSTFTASADVGISLTEGNCLNHEFCLPNKVFEYVMSEVPVIVPNLTEQRNFVTKYDLGYVLENNDENDLVLLINLIDRESLEVKTFNLKKAKNENSWQVEEQIMLKAYKDYVASEKKELIT